MGDWSESSLCSVMSYMCYSVGQNETPQQKLPYLEGNQMGKNVSELIRQQKQRAGDEKHETYNHFHVRENHNISAKLLHPLSCQVDFQFKQPA